MSNRRTAIGGTGQKGSESRATHRADLVELEQASSSVATRLAVTMHRLVVMPKGAGAQNVGSRAQGRTEDDRHERGLSRAVSVSNTAVLCDPKKGMKPWLGGVEAMRSCQNSCLGRHDACSCINRRWRRSDSSRGRREAAWA